jgi:hypothetical protein
MNTSIALFLLGCIPARIGLALIPRYIDIDYVVYWAAVILLIGIGFLYLFFTGKRTSGIETGGKPIWWMRFRIFHGLMYLSAAFYALQKNVSVASNIIFADTAVGLGLFLNHHFGY